MSQIEKPFVNAVYVTATEGNEDKLQDVMLGTVGAALATPGNHGFSILKSTEKPANFLIIEHWGSNQEYQIDAGSAVVTKALETIAEQQLVVSAPSGSRWTRII